MADKILYANKEKLLDDITIPNKNKVTADDMNEIKEVVNAHADDIDELDEVKANRTEIPTDLSELSNENTKFVNETQLSEAIESEESAREEADENIQGQIDSINDDISALDDRVELNEGNISDIKREQIAQDEEIGALKLDSGHTIELSLNTTNYELSAKLKNKSGTVLNTSTVDLPLETMIINVEYDNANKQLIITLQNGNKIYVPIADIIGGLQSEITPENMLSSDLVDDNNHAHKFMSISEKTKLEGIETGAEVNVIEVIKVDGTAITVTDKTVNIDLSAKEDKSNKVTEITDESTDTQYPSAKAVYDSQELQDASIEALEDRVEILENTVESELEDTTATGTSITVNDSANAPAKLLPSGNTFQKQLPNEYQAVDYIEATGTQYINTNFSPDITKKLKFETDIMWSNDIQTRQNIGGDYGQFFGIRDGVYQIGTNNTTIIPSSNKFDHIIAEMDRINNKQSINVDGTTAIYNRSSWDTSIIYVFALKLTAGANYYTSCKMRGFKIFENDEIKMSLVPCYRISDNEIGMYDLITNAFFTKSGTGTFLKGSDSSFPSPSYPQTIHNVSGHSEFKISNADDTEYQIAEFTLVEGQKMFLGDYLADDGIHHVRTHYILDGTEDCSLRSANDNGTYTYLFNSLLVKKIKANCISLCSHFQFNGLVSNGDSTKTMEEGYSFYYTYGGLNRTLYINSTINNLENFKAFLAQEYANGTPVTIEYETALGNIEPYTELQQAQYNALKNVMSYYEQTNVNTISAGDLEAILNLDYKKSNRLRIEALENAIISLGGNI